MKTLVLCLFVLVLGRFFEKISMTVQISVDEQEIHITLMNYLCGQKKGDFVQLRTAFNVRTGLDYDCKDHVKGTRSDNKRNCISRIVSVNITNAAAQSVINIEYPKRLFTDYINHLPIVLGKYIAQHRISKCGMQI